MSHSFCGSGFQVQLSWVPLPQGFTQSRYPQGWSPISKFPGGEPSSKLIHVNTSRIQFLVSYWTPGREPPLVPCHMGLSVGQLIAWDPPPIRADKQENATQKQPLYHLILEVTSHHLHICLSEGSRWISSYSLHRAGLFSGGWGPSERLPAATTFSVRRHGGAHSAVSVDWSLQAPLPMDFYRQDY